MKISLFRIMSEGFFKNDKQIFNYFRSMLRVETHSKLELGALTIIYKDP